jgi:hypothetical protein
LQVTPRPGEFCVVTKSDSLEIPEPCYNAARASTFRRMESGPIHHYPMFGMEAQMVGGTYLPKYSHPQAFGFAAEMAFDEAVVHAGLLVMEPWIGLTLSAEPDAVSELLAILTRPAGDHLLYKTFCDPGASASQAPGAHRTGPGIGQTENLSSSERAAIPSIERRHCSGCTAG